MDENAPTNRPQAAGAIYAQSHAVLGDAASALCHRKIRPQNLPMHLSPYQSVNGTAFTATRADVLHAHGQPRSEERNNVGLTALDYCAVVYRFQDNGRLEEVTARAPVLHLGNVAVTFANLAAFVRANDAAAFERAGFLVSPRYGIAFVPGEPCWVTALARHCLPQWLAMGVS